MLFTDVADVLSISNPVIVEKDYYAVLLLKELSSLHCDDYQLVFAGGTCLTKVHQNTYRMSEDIDIKLVASNEALGKAHSLQRHNDSPKNCFHAGIFPPISTGGNKKT